MTYNPALARHAVATVGYDALVGAAGTWRAVDIAATKRRLRRRDVPLIARAAVWWAACATVLVFGPVAAVACTAVYAPAVYLRAKHGTHTWRTSRRGPVKVTGHTRQGRPVRAHRRRSAAP